MQSQYELFNPCVPPPSLGTAHRCTPSHFPLVLSLYHYVHIYRLCCVHEWLVMHGLLDFVRFITFNCTLPWQQDVHKKYKHSAIDIVHDYIIDIVICMLGCNSAS